MSGSLKIEVLIPNTSEIKIVTETKMCSIGSCGNFALSALLETWLKEAGLETNVKNKSRPQKIHIPKCENEHQNQQRIITIIFKYVLHNWIHLDICSSRQACVPPRQGPGQTSDTEQEDVCNIHMNVLRGSAQDGIIFLVWEAGRCRHSSNNSFKMHQSFVES